MAIKTTKVNLFIMQHISLPKSRESFLRKLFSKFLENSFKSILLPAHFFQLVLHDPFVK